MTIILHEIFFELGLFRPVEAGILRSAPHGNPSFY